jgi:hypothetical protein
MFGKPRDIDDTAILDPNPVDGFFGDEAAAEAIVELHELQTRVEHVESQIASQFTSLATYAQIAQEQVEIARAEAKAHVERSEQRLTSLIERERADRLSGADPVPARGAVHEDFSRLDLLEGAVSELRAGLDECIKRQRALADAITTMFEWLSSPRPGLPDATADEAPAPEPEPETDEKSVISFSMSFPAPAPAPATMPLSGPIADLSLEG